MGNAVDRLFTSVHNFSVFFRQTADFVAGMCITALLSCRYHGGIHTVIPLNLCVKPALVGVLHISTPPNANTADFFSSFIYLFGSQNLHGGLSPSASGSFNRQQYEASQWIRFRKGVLIYENHL